MALDLTIDELLTTTRTVRKRLDCDRPVERSIIEECVEIAMQAPSGANSQGWQWLFVDEPELKAQLAVIYRKQFDVTYRVMPIAAYDDPELQAQAVRRRASATWLADNFERVPLIMVPCSRGTIDGATLGAQAGFWGVVPAGRVELHVGAPQPRSRFGLGDHEPGAPGRRERDG
jgi:nitroreductase